MTVDWTIDPALGAREGFATVDGLRTWFAIVGDESFALNERVCTHQKIWQHARVRAFSVAVALLHFASASGRRLLDGQVLNAQGFQRSQYFIRRLQRAAKLGHHDVTYGDRAFFESTAQGDLRDVRALGAVQNIDQYR